MNIGSASAIFLKNIHDVLVSGTILLYGIWNMVCGIWYENGIHSVFEYVLCASCSGCQQCSVSIPCPINLGRLIFFVFKYNALCNLYNKFWTYILSVRPAI